ncbi:MAG: hypothetical protein ACK6DB_08570 [Planctomycetota bacterium]
MTLFEVTQHPLIEKIKRIDTDHLTPLRALEAITSWQRELAGEAVEESAASRKPR